MTTVLPTHELSSRPAERLDLHRSGSGRPVPCVPSRCFVVTYARVLTERAIARSGARSGRAVARLAAPLFDCPNHGGVELVRFGRRHRPGENCSSRHRRHPGRARTTPVHIRCAQACKWRKTSSDTWSSWGAQSGDKGAPIAWAMQRRMESNNRCLVRYTQSAGSSTGCHRRSSEGHRAATNAACSGESIRRFVGCQHDQRAGPGA